MDKNKDKKRKKLTLNRETVRRLQDKDLEKVVGGTIVSVFLCPVSPPGACPCTGTSDPAPTGINDCF